VTILPNDLSKLHYVRNHIVYESRKYKNNTGALARENINSNNIIDGTAYTVRM